MVSRRNRPCERTAWRALPRLVVVVAALALAVAAAAQPRDGETPSPAAFRATGAASIFNSHEGEAIVSSSALRPGASATGTVSIRNTGSVPAAFALRRGELSNAPGPGGGLLSDVLVLDVAQLTEAGPVTLYSGPLRGMGGVAIARAFAPGETREFGFAVRFPDGGPPSSATSGDNAYQGSTATVRFDWEAVGEDAAPADPAPSSPAPSGDPAPAPDPEPAPFFGWPAIDPAPEVKLVAPRRWSVSRRGDIPLVAKCTATCRVTAKASLEGPPAFRKLKPRVFKVKSRPGTVAFRVRLPAAARRAAARALRASAPLRLVVSLRVRRDGQTERVTRKISLTR